MSVVLNSCFFFSTKSNPTVFVPRHAPPIPPYFPIIPKQPHAIHPSLLFRFGVVLQEVGCEPLHGVLWPRFHQSCQTVYQQGDHSALQVLPNGQGLERELVGDLHRRGLRGGALRPTRTKERKRKVQCQQRDGKGSAAEGNGGGRGVPRSEGPPAALGARSASLGRPPLPPSSRPLPPPPWSPGAPL